MLNHWLNYTILFLAVFSISSVVGSQNGNGRADLQTEEIDSLVKYVKIWVFFEEKNKEISSIVLTKRALSRRSTVDFNNDMADVLINKSYIDEIQKLGGIFENVYKWGNAASFRIPLEVLPRISQLQFVKSIIPVHRYTIQQPPSGTLKKSNSTNQSIYQKRKAQLDVLKILQAHLYLLRKKGVEKPGEGVFIGFFDSGFRLDHKCFNHLKRDMKIKAMHDFVDGDEDPQDSDSLLNHGTTVLAQVAGYDPDTFTGAAWGADIALARTEISENELHIEEDNWVAALVWAESLGVDIVSSSLGYAVDFEDSVLIGNKYVADYPYNSLDGHSTIISHAADLAVKRGMIIVNSIGNEGSNLTGTLNAPADVDGVVAVGSIDLQGIISDFSSTGPTSDGRIKPDCVAPGEDIVVPRFKQIDTYATTFTGTSYSAPLVSGVVALIMQSVGRPYKSSDVIGKLFSSCTYAYGQDTIDNKYGRGVPDALLSVMDSDEVIVETTDSTGIHIQGITLRSADGQLSAKSDSSGLIYMNTKKQASSFFLISPWDTIHFDVERFPNYKHIILNTVPYIEIKVVDDELMPVSNCDALIMVPSDNSKWNLKTGDNGKIRFVYGKETPIEIRLAAKGYYTPGIVSSLMSTSGNSVVITVSKIPENSFIVFPTVVRKKDQQVTLIFSFALQSKPSDITALIYSVSGNLVWRERKKSQTNVPVEFQWKFREGSQIVPGIYYAIIRYGKNTYKQKMLISG
jgi:hypothetical protein